MCLIVSVVLSVPLCSVGVSNGLLCDLWGLLLGFLGPIFFVLFSEAQRGPLLAPCCFGQLWGRPRVLRFLINLVTLIVLCAPASELSISVKNSLVGAVSYILLAPGKWLIWL